jgi:small subunit ribosomal protein S21
MPVITVHHNDVEFALRLLKRQLQHSGLLRELRRRRQYEKPSARRRRHKRAGIRNTRKRARLAHGERPGHPPHTRVERRGQQYGVDNHPSSMVDRRRFLTVVSRMDTIVFWICACPNRSCTNATAAPASSRRTAIAWRSV